MGLLQSGLFGDGRPSDAQAGEPPGRRKMATTTTSSTPGRAAALAAYWAAALPAAKPWRTSRPTDGIGRRPPYVEYKVSAPAAGEYEIRVGAMLGGGSEQYPTAVIVNNGKETDVYAADFPL